MRTPLPYRRSFLAMTGVSTAAFVLGTGRAASAEDLEGGPLPADPFTLGVASGDPLPDGVVLWTRLAPEPLAADGHGGMPRSSYAVHYEVAEDERFARIAAKGRVTATAELGHSVHAEVHGLRAGREYFYRFKAGGHLSPVGRTKTAPDPRSRVEAFRFATASCQAWYHGFFTAYRHMADEDLDMVLFLGDYIYEYGITAANWRRQGQALPPAPHNADVSTLEQYRLRYSLFRTDPDLQRIHAHVPWVVTTDDHEVVNNYADDRDEYGTPPSDLLRRRAVAYRAFYENLPLRSASRSHGPDLPLHRRLRWGRLADIDVLDTRQYRDFYPAGAVIDDSPERLDPKRTILGGRQERWLYDGLRRSQATWNVLAQQVVMAGIDRDTGPGELYSNDQWDGFPANRDRLYAAMRRYDIANPVVLTGDVHHHIAIEHKADWKDPDSATIATELVGTSIGSDGDGAENDAYGPLWLANRHVKLYNARRGYLSCTMTPERLTSEFKTVPYVTRPGAPVNVLARFVTEAGRPGLNREV
ncbi:alkaline phosphatase D family protein [Thermomonospora umbrina]|uniref:Alkaline phosphatase D n=1 Tax=Thermomonospora umbrina TaxID=111806 RepID=A0A3D9T535_9ACTN|nr:alkaline phosphatase D family protein [Thermomonospora umbrina]REE99814.1 alkaline phosphatase D [Thermomonospora umbrina]